MPSDTRTDLPEQRILEQSMRLPGDGAVTGWAACRLHGANFFDGLARDGITPIPVPLNVGPHGNLRPDDRVRLCHHELNETERTSRYGIPTVTTTRATYDAMRLAEDEREAVVALDMMAAAEVVSMRMIGEYAALRPCRHRRQIDSAIRLATEHSRSPNESRLRLVWRMDAELPPPLVNCAVHDRHGRLLGIADLLDENAGLVVEFDGADHRRARRQTADVQKEERLRRVGLEVTRVTGLELSDRASVVGRLRAARGRAAFLPHDERRWVAVPPPDDLHQRILEREDANRMHKAMAAEPLPDIREVRGY